MDTEEDEVKVLKEQRSKLKNKVTISATKLEKAVNTNKEYEQLSRQLEDVYEQFCDVHMTYAEKVLSSDGQLDKYKTVGGLDLDACFDAVKSVCDKAESCVLEREKIAINAKADDMVNTITISLSECKNFISELDDYCTTNTDTDSVGPTPVVICEEAERVSNHLTDLKRELRSFSVQHSKDYSSLFSEVDTTIVNLKRKVTCARRKSVVHVQHSVPTRITAPIYSGSRSNSPQSALNDRETRDNSNRVPQSTGDHDNSEMSTQNSLPQVQPVNNHVPRMNAHSVVNPVGETTPNRLVHSSSPISGNVSLSHQASELSSTSAYANRDTGRNYSSPAPSQTIPTMCRTETRFKKPPAPTFDGNRKLWAEFRAIWGIYANSECRTDDDRAWALKQCLKGQALEHVRAIYVNQPNAYLRMWHRLESIYSDVSMSVQYAYDGLRKLKPVKEEDIKGFISFINSIEQCYSQLGEVQQINSVTMTQIDDLSDLLPLNVRKDWMRKFHGLAQGEKIHPFTPFMLFLEGEREIAIRLSERRSSRHDGTKDYAQVAKKSAQSNVSAGRVDNSKCMIHTTTNCKHTTEQCREFIDKTVQEKKSLLAKNRACFRCFEKHMRKDCQANDACKNCGLTNHHTLMCNPPKGTSGNSNADKTKSADVDYVEATGCHASKKSHSTVLFPIMSTKVVGTAQQVSLFFDSGSNTTYITHEAAKRVKADRIGQVKLNITAVGNVETAYYTTQYKVKLVTKDQAVVNVVAYGLEEITGPVTKLKMNTVRNLFPDYTDINGLQRMCSSVDILVGNDYHGLHPKTEIDKCGAHLSIMEGTFGRCLSGTHPKLHEATRVVSGIVDCSVVDNDVIMTATNLIHAKSSKTHLSRASMSTIDRFIKGEDMGCEVSPKCGGCKCSKCPVSGHTYSFQEEQELNLIRQNLTYNREKAVWVTKYPWTVHPDRLPDNYRAVLATLGSTERNLKKGGEEWSRAYSTQIQDMIDRGVARKLSEKEKISGRTLCTT